MRRLIVFILFFFLSAMSSAHAGTVTDLRIARYNGNLTRLILDTDSSIPYRAFVLNNPMRVVIDLPALKWSAPMNKGDRNGIIKSYRKGLYNNDTTRLVLELARPAVIDTHARLVPGHSGERFQYVFDLRPVDAVTFNRAINRVAVGGGAPETATQNITPPSGALDTTPSMQFPPSSLNKSPTLTAKSPSQRPLIVIDAGHGGVDPGARAVTGMHEKQITLSAAKAAKRHLESTGKYRVQLTRDRDIFIKLPERVAIARRAGADLFVSLHADTIGRPHVHGASVYTLSDKASDAETAKLAARENAVDNLVNVDVGNVERDVADILIDLVTRDTMNQSRILAETVVRTFKDQGLATLPQNPHRSAGFAVLKAPDIPSVLIEMGYLSNEQEARNLSDEIHRDKIGRAVAQTIDRFFNDTRAEN